MDQRGGLLLFFLSSTQPLDQIAGRTAVAPLLGLKYQRLGHEFLRSS